MKTPGQILREARLSRGLSLETVEKIIKIRVKYLKALETDDYSVLPSISYAKGFIKNYSDYLGLNTSNILAFFRRENKEMSRQVLLPKSDSKLLRSTFLQLTPKRFIILIIILLISIFGLYFGIQYRNLQMPPKLNIFSPKNGIITKENKIELLGQTDEDATVTLNGINILVRDDGKFFDTLNLNDGENLVEIIAISRYGKINKKTIKVSFKVED
jgi:cytoskeletal protein RodZ